MVRPGGVMPLPRAPSVIRDLYTTADPKRTEKRHKAQLARLAEATRLIENGRDPVVEWLNTTHDWIRRHEGYIAERELSAALSRLALYRLRQMDEEEA